MRRHEFRTSFHFFSRKNSNFCSTFEVPSQFFFFVKSRPISLSRDTSKYIGSIFYRPTKRVQIRLPTRSEGVCAIVQTPTPSTLREALRVSSSASVYLTCSTRQHVSLNNFFCEINIFPKNTFILFERELDLFNFFSFSKFIGAKRIFLRH